MTEDFENPIDKIIREARERGDFDNLPGKGKPLHWDDEAHVPEDKRMANHLLKSNNFTLDWIALGQELDAAYEQIKRELAHARAERAAGRIGAADWPVVAKSLAEKLRALNRKVIGYNVRVPHEQFSKRPYPIDPDLKDR